MKRLLIFLVIALYSCASPVTPTRAPAPTSRPPTARPASVSENWRQASSYAGSYAVICGPVVDSNYARSSNGQPTFLNIGRPYPDSGRFTILIWGDDRGNFSVAPESFFFGKDLCVAGVVEMFNGIPQIEVSSPAQIEVR